MTFTLSIETAPGQAYQHGYHLGTDERLARQIVTEKFAARREYGLPTLTMGLKKDGRLVDTFYGDRWHSELTD